MSSPDTTLREMLIEVAPPALRAAGRALIAAETAMLVGTRRRGRVRRAARRLGRPRRLRAGGRVGGRRPAQRQDAGRRLRDTHDRRAERWRTQAARARRAAHQRRRRAAARRARQLPRRADPRVAGGADQVVPVDDPDGQPRPHAAVERRHQGDLRRGLRMLGARRFVPDVPRGAGQAPGATRRRSQAVERRGAAPVPPHEDHEAARRPERQQRAARPTPPRPGGRSSSRPDLHRRQCPTSTSSSSCAAPTPPGAWCSSPTCRSATCSCRSATRSTTASGSD